MNDPGTTVEGSGSMVWNWVQKVRNCELRTDGDRETVMGGGQVGWGNEKWPDRWQMYHTDGG